MPSKIKIKNAYLRKESKQYPSHLIKIEDVKVSEGMNPKPTEVWRSNAFLVTLYVEANGLERMSVCRTELNEVGRWVDRIMWDDLQRLKRECGRGDRCAIEVYPADQNLVNVANMRHLWFMSGHVGWKNEPKPQPATGDSNDTV